MDAAIKRAEKLFVEHLTDEERLRISATPDLRTLLRETKELEDKLRTEGNDKFTSKLHRLGQKAIQLEPFEKLLEGGAKTSPKAGEMIWGSISFLLEMVKNNARAFDDALNFFERFEDEMGYIDLQKEAFRNSSLVHSVSEALSIAILDFWVAAVKYFRAKTGGLRARVFAFITASFIEKKFVSLKVAIADQKDRMDKITSAEHNAQSSNFYADTQFSQRITRQRDLQKWLNAADYEYDFRTAKGLRYEGTCEWIRERQPYVDWASWTSTPLLFIQGIPGSGKTVLSSWIIDDLRTSRNQELLLYHYFKDTDDNRRTLLSVIRSFIDQLLDYLRDNQNPLLTRFESDLQKESLTRSGHTSYPDLWSLFSPTVAALATSILQQSQRSHVITFVMDAMDECESPAPLIVDLLDLAQTHEGQIRVLVTGRKSAWDVIKQSTAASLSSANELEITTEDVDTDIQAFVEHTIHNVPRMSDHPRLRARLIDEIGRATNHRGMFLWAFFMCEEVKRQGDPDLLEKLLGNLPKGLDAMYGRICQAMADKGLDLSLFILQWLVHSPRSLRFSELQAGLELMRPPLSGHDAWFDERGGLLWSRQDIVKACDNLVIYTGLADGDSFGLVHLSATQFFLGKLGQGNDTILPETAKLFRGNIRNAHFKLASLCLQYLLAEALLSHEYLSISATFRSSPVIKKADFAAKFPLFEFAVSYWPGFVLDGLPAQHGHIDIPTLARVFTSFECTSAVIIWFVHAIKGLGIAIVMDQVQQLAANVGMEDPSLMLITTWACKAFDRMNAYYEQISRWPELIIKCWPMETMRSKTGSLTRTWQNVWPEVISKATTQTAQRFPQSIWFHYDPQKDLFFGVDDCPICLRVHSLKSGASMRAGLVPPHHGMPRFSPLRAAVVSPSSRFVAAIFDTRYGGESDLHPVLLVCWRLPGGTNVSGISDACLEMELDVILCEQYNTVLCSIPGPSESMMPDTVDSRLAFVGDNMLVTPRGMWDLRKKKWLSGLDFTSNDFSGDLCFSGNGSRAACIDESGNEFNLFNIQDGRLIYASGLKLSETKFLRPLAFSHSGQRIVFCKYLLQPTKMDGACGARSVCTGYGHRFSCLIADGDEQYTIELHTPLHLHAWEGMKAQFSNNEETLVVAGLYICPAEDPDVELEVMIIAVWKLIRDAKGRYTQTSFTCYYKQWAGFFKFCLVPAFDSDPERVFVVTHGIVEQRALDQIWSTTEEAAFWDENHGKQIVNVDPKLKTIVVKTLSTAGNEKTLAQSKKWSFGSLPPQLIMTSASILDIPLKSISQSSNGYFATDSQALIQVIQVFDGDTTLEQNKCPQVLLYTERSRIKAYAFSANDDRVVLLHHNPQTKWKSYPMVTVTVYQNVRAHDGSLFGTTKIASSELQVDLGDNMHFKLQFNPVDSSHFLLMICDHDPDFRIRTSGKSRVISIRLSKLGVSNDICFLPQEEGGPWQIVLVDGPQQLRFPRVLALPQRNSSENELHPLIMKDLEYYIHNQCVFLLREYASVITLYQLSLFGEVKLWAERVICVLPTDAHKGVNFPTFLIWPEEDEEEITIVLAGRDGDPFVIETGILSRDLLVEDAWSIKEQGLKEASLRTESDEEMDDIDCEDETVSDEEMSGVDDEDETESDEEMCGVDDENETESDEEMSGVDGEGGP
ncbi:hypothetical protein H0H93_016239 [Arthromyces matolae]|nr:hypothetical protein H0H93_016239 [Arthromyces matolae]